MSNRNQKAAKVIEQEGEIDEDYEEQTQQSNSSNQQNVSTSNNTLPSENNLDKQSNKSQTVIKEKVFDDIIGLKTHFEEYKNSQLNEIANKMSSLKIAQDENQNGIQQVKHNLTEEEKIKQIRQTFSLAPLYIFKLKGLKNRMSKIEEKINKAKILYLTLDNSNSNNKNTQSKQ